MIYSNPYMGVDFFRFFLVFFSRLWGLCTGQLTLATDELQVLTLAAIAVSAALLGAFLLLRRMAMLANALSHTALVGTVSVFLFVAHGSVLEMHTPYMLLGAVATSVLTIGCISLLSGRFSIQEDASMGLVFTTLFAIGIILTSLFARHSHIGIEVITGSVDTLIVSDFILALQVLIGNVLLLALLFPFYAVLSFDREFSVTSGLPVRMLHYVMMLQVSATVVAGMRVVGVFMILALLLFPPMTARLFTRTLRGMLLLASGLGVLSALLGVAWSRHMLSIYSIPLSTSGVTICVLVLFYIAAIIVSQYRKKVVCSE